MITDLKKKLYVSMPIGNTDLQTQTKYLKLINWEIR